MKRETIDLKHGRLEVLIDGNFIYIKMFGEYTDNNAVAMTKYLENFFSEVGGSTIRVWDTTSLSKRGFKVTAKGIERFVEWSREITMKWPENVVYMVSNSPFKYGLSRMYELQASDINSSVIVVHSIDELPENIKNRIFQ